MNLPSKFTKNIVASTLLLGTLLVHSASATVLVSDSFALNGTTRTAGAGLDNLPPEYETGSAVWQSVFGRFGTSGGITTPDGFFGAGARIGITPPADNILSVSAQFSVATLDWGAIGFFQSSSSSDRLNSDGLVWALVRPSGDWTIFLNGTSTEVASGTIASFSEPFTLGLSYDTSNQTARFYTIIGSTETSLISTNDGWFSTGFASGTTSTAAGFTLNGGGSTIENSPLVSNFSVTAIPEPSSAVLLLGAFGIAILVTRRRKR